MDERQLHAVLKIGEYASITKAAASLHISPQGLSNQLDAIERELSAQLFFRTRKGCFLTPAGKKFCELAPALIEHLSSFADAVKNADDPQLVLRIALWKNRGNYIEDEIAHQYRLKYPDVRIKYVPVSERGIVADIADGYIDVAYCADKAIALQDSRVQASVFKKFRMSFNCYMRSDSPLVKQNTDFIKPNMLDHHNIALISPLNVAFLFDVPIAETLEADKYEVVEKCFDDWVCIADSFYELSYPGISCIPLDVPSCQILVLHRANPSSAAVLFLDAVEEQVESLL